MSTLDCLPETEISFHVIYQHFLESVGMCANAEELTLWSLLATLCICTIVLCTLGFSAAVLGYVSPIFGTCMERLLNSNAAAIIESLSIEFCEHERPSTELVTYTKPAKVTCPQLVVADEKRLSMLMGLLFKNGIAGTLRTSIFVTGCPSGMFDIGLNGTCIEYIFYKNAGSPEECHVQALMSKPIVSASEHCIAQEETPSSQLVAAENDTFRTMLVKLFIKKGNTTIEMTIMIEFPSTMFGDDSNGNSRAMTQNGSIALSTVQQLLMSCSISILCTKTAGDLGFRSDILTVCPQKCMSATNLVTAIGRGQSLSKKAEIIIATPRLYATVSEADMGSFSQVDELDVESFFLHIEATTGVFTLVKLQDMAALAVISDNSLVNMGNIQTQDVSDVQPVAATVEVDKAEDAPIIHIHETLISSVPSEAVNQVVHTPQEKLSPLVRRPSVKEMVIKIEEKEKLFRAQSGTFKSTSSSNRKFKFSTRHSNVNMQINDKVERKASVNVQNTVCLESPEVIKARAIIADNKLDLEQKVQKMKYVWYLLRNDMLIDQVCESQAIGVLLSAGDMFSREEIATLRWRKARLDAFVDRVFRPYLEPEQRPQPDYKTFTCVNNYHHKGLPKRKYEIEVLVEVEEGPEDDEENVYMPVYTQINKSYKKQAPKSRSYVQMGTPQRLHKLDVRMNVHR